jgi:hypothetical protein
MPHDLGGSAASYMGVDNYMPFLEGNVKYGSGVGSSLESEGVRMSQIDKSLEGSSTGASSFRSSAFRSSLYSDQHSFG